MNGIEKITARIETDAKAEVAGILREAEEKAAAIREQYKVQAEAEAKAAAAGGKEAAKRQGERLESAAGMEAKKRMLAAKQACLDEAAKAGGKAGEILSKVVTGANALLQGTAMLTLSQETRDMAGGLTLRDGNVEVNCAFETQLRVLREEMAAEVAGILFS